MEYAIQLKNVTKTFGKVVANKNVNLDVKKGEILSLLGENGSGKTTLMKILLGLEPSDSGEIYIRKNCRISYLEQQTSSVSLKPLYDEVLSVYSDLIELEKKIDVMNKKADMTEAEASLAAKLHETYVSGGGLEFRSRVSSALKGLGLILSLCSGLKSSLLIIRAHFWLSRMTVIFLTASQTRPSAWGTESFRFTPGITRFMLS